MLLLIFCVFAFQIGFAQTQDSIIRHLDWRLKANGQARLKFYHFNNQDWEKGNNQNYLLTRFLANTSISYKNRFTFFIELQSGLANGIQGPIIPVNENILDLHQVFARFSLFDHKKEKAEITMGRQEFSYGSERLISVRDGPNNRQSFDAAKFHFVKQNWTVDAFAGTYVDAKLGFFNDEFLNNQQVIWGIYAVRKQVPLIKNLDLYYLGIKRSAEQVNNQVYDTKKHSVGLRIWQLQNGFTYDMESLVQLGKSKDDKKIRAFTVSANLSYRFQDRPLKPEIGVKLQYISGDKDSTDQRIESFDPMYPKGAYFGLNSVIGPRNLTNFHFYSNISPFKKAQIGLEYVQFYRSSTQDAIYLVTSVPVILAKPHESAYIGNQWELSTNYQINNKLSFKTNLTYFKAGKFIKESHQVGYFATSATINYSF